MTERCRTPRHNQATIRRTREVGNAALDLPCIADVHRRQLHSEGRCNSLSSSEQAKSRRDRGVAQNGRSSKIGSDLFEQLEPFRTHAVLVNSESRRIAAWSSQTRDKTSAYRVYDTREYNGDSTGRFQQGGYGGGSIGEYDVGHQRDQFGCRLAIAAGVTRSPAGFDLNVLALFPAQCVQSVEEGSDALSSLDIIGGRVHKHPDAPQRLGLLRARDQRPRHSAADEYKEFPPSHSTASSKLTRAGYQRSSAVRGK